MMTIQIGTTLKSYTIEGLIGQGGFGAVYRAKQDYVDREVAIKVIWPAFASRPNFIRRFENEAQLVAGLEHPYIVPLYDYWREPDGAYIVMRYLRGGALRQAMDQRRYSLKDVERLVGQVTAALSLAHHANVVHRDIKPENILLDRQDNAYLADFGIAQIVRSAHDDDDAFFTSMGSPAYAAPEQIQGSETPPQSDLYSLGIILYEMLVGEHPFPQLEMLSATEMNQLRATTPIPSLLDKVPHLPPALDEVLQQATALHPADRFADALSMGRAFQQAIRSNGRAAPSPTALMTDVIPNPYKGLRAFQEGDTANFFGREALIERLLDRLREEADYARFLAVVGPSGSGKSSVVKAGVIPRLRAGALPGSENWFYDEVVPGEQPFSEIVNSLVSVAVDEPQDLLERLLANERGLHGAVNAILPEDTQLLLFIDQFEELFTLVEDEATVSHFLRSLYTAVTAPDSKLRVIITIRADFYDRPLLQPLLSDMVRERTEVIVPLTTDELERAIVEPARRVGVTIDSGLVAAIIAEVREQPGALPLLQYTLSELFERREGGFISPEAYRRLGGVRGALAQRAEELYTSLEPDEQTVTRQLFLRLITLGEGTEDTRRRALLSEISSLQDENSLSPSTVVMNRVVNLLGKARLLTFDRDPETRSPTLEVTHEAIIREWRRLRTWLDESRNDVRNQRTLANLAQEWAENGADRSFLLRGVRLDSYETWAQGTSLSLTALERDYLTASLDERARQEEAERIRQEREAALERRSLNRLRLLVVVLAGGLVIAALLTGVAVNASQQANESAQDALEAAQVSQSIALQSSALNVQADGDHDLGILLALQAVSGDNPPLDAMRTLTDIAFSTGTRLLLTEHMATVNDVAIAPDGGLIASGSDDFAVRLWDAQSGALLQTLEGHGADVTSVDFSPDGRFVVSGAFDFDAIVWDVAGGMQVLRLDGHQDNVLDAHYSPDGRLIATASKDGTIILWDAATGEPRRTLDEGSGVRVLKVAFTPDGQRLLASTQSRVLQLWDVASGQLLRTVDTSATVFAVHPGGSAVVTGGGGSDIVLWDLDSGAEMLRFIGTPDDIGALSFAAEGRLLYSAVGRDILLWDVATGLVQERLGGHDAPVTALATSMDGQRLISSSEDTTIRVWNIGQPGAERILLGHEDRVTDVALDAAGTRAYTASADSTLRAWDLQTGAMLAEQPFDERLQSIALSPDDSTLLLGMRDGQLLALDASTYALRWGIQAHEDAIEEVLFLAGGQQALTAALDGAMILWDVASGEALRRYESPAGDVYGLALNDDETQFVSGARDGEVILWDIDSGEQLRRYEGHEGTVYALDFHPNEPWIVSSSRDGLLILWDVTSAETLAQVEVAEQVGVWDVEFSPDGQSMISASLDGQVIRWDVASGGIVQRFLAAEGVFAASFTPDGENAITGLGNGDVILWRTYSPQRLVQWVQQNRYLRPFTCVEAEQYRLGEDVECVAPPTEEP